MTNLPEPPEELEDASEPADDGTPAEQAADIDMTISHRKYAGRVLVTAASLVLFGLLLYACWPWLLPVFIYEGPLVQLAGEHEATIVWHLTRPVENGLSLELGGEKPRVLPVEIQGTRCRVKLTDLVSGQSYPYTIRLNERKLIAAEYRANKPAGQPFSFLAFGDSGRASREQYLLAARMAVYTPDLVLHTGDLIYSHGERHRYRERFFQPYHLLIESVAFWPSIGNHDVVEPIDESAYFEVFDLPTNGPAGISPEHEYWFDYGNARFVILDTERSEVVLKENVAPWLRSVLQDAPVAWKFVVFHRPPYTAGAHPCFVPGQNAIVPVLEETGVDLVFSGHDHMYERTYPIRGGKRAENGPVYIVTGAGGAQLYEAQPPEKRPDYIAVIHNEVHSFTHVQVSAAELTLEQIALDGSYLDKWTLSQETAARP